MRRRASISLFLFIAVLVLVSGHLGLAGDTPAPSSAGDVQVSVQVALVGADLAVKPVPKWPLAFVPESAPQSEIEFSTSFEGKASGPLPAGRYRIRSKRSVEFEGKTYRWEIAFEVLPGRPVILELSNDNAIVEESASPGAESGKGTTSKVASTTP